MILLPNISVGICNSPKYIIMIEEFNIIKAQLSLIARLGFFFYGSNSRRFPIVTSNSLAFI